MTYKSRIPQIVKQMNANVADSVKQTGEAVEAGAKRRTHDVTGELDASIHVLPVSDSEAVVEASAPYAAYVEHGTHTASAHPFMTPAAEVERPLHTQRVRQAVRKAVE